MSAVDTEVKVRKIIKDPRMSLTMIGRLVVASERKKLTIIKNSKYPSEFVPGYYELARKAVCDAFESNFIDDYHLYFDDFKRKSAEYLKTSRTYSKETVLYKNNFFSAESLDGIVAMSAFLIPMLENHNFHSNLTQKKNAIMQNSVRIGAMADMLLYDQYGLEHIGFLKFNFSKTKFPAEEAAVKVQVLKRFYEKNNIDLNPKDCILVDVPTRRIYTLNELPDAKKSLDKATNLIWDNWDLV